MTEIWKPIEGWFYYEVSNLGNVRTLGRTVITGNGAMRTYPAKLLSQEKLKSGYFRVWFCKDGKQARILVHRLVALAFVINPTNLPFVNHKDGIRSNSHADNLEWCTREFNAHHSIQIGLSVGWKKDQIDAILSMSKAGMSSVEIAKAMNCSRQSVADVRFGRIRSLVC